ncbi:MAG: cysteine--tRNA ligase [Candidatus Bathyarchaeia archaeon]
MALRFFNTLSKRKEEFKPLRQGEVRVYTCGPTVYDYAHIGNFRTYVFQDLLRRWLEYRGYRVYQVMNLTDVDDKTIKKSRMEGLPLRQFTQKYIDAFFEDLEKLKIKKAEVYPRATEHLADMVNLIKSLLQSGYAYMGDDRSIYFDVSKFKGYGKLSGLKVGGLKAGARVKNDLYGKGEPRDFALWKAWSEEDGDVYWETELGKGRPGWHIECSAMSMKYLGETFDIHSGGIDLIFPHHENEIAQSEAATGKPLANYWLHCEHLLVDGRKMSKSLGNFYTLRDLLDKGYSPAAIRYVLLSTHYRRYLNFTFQSLDAATSTLERVGEFFTKLREASGGGRSREINGLLEAVERGFCEAMDDDLDINTALAHLFKFIRRVNVLLREGTVSKGDAEKIHSLMMSLNRVLGIIDGVPVAESLPEEILDMIKRREEARRRKDWATADQLRSLLQGRGIILEDTPTGVKVKKKF